MSPIPRLSSFSGPAILSYGFRPFFLAGAIYASLDILVWIPMYLGRLSVPTALSPINWHIHEMLYGYLPAVVTGFLLTAIPNWTGRLPLQGTKLAFLVTLWIAGRIAIGTSELIGRLPSAIIDLSFLIVVVGATSREVFTGRSWRNLPPIFIVSLFLIGNLIFHIEDYYSGIAEYGTRLGIAAAVMLISLIGGRVIPSFTHNWLAKWNPGRLPTPFGLFDKVVLGISLFALIVWVSGLDSTWTAILMAVAAMAHAIRLCRWAGDRAASDWLVLILHVGYAFVPAGFALIAASGFLPEAVPVSAGIHAWTAGAIGTMTLAIMTRATLGHTAQPLIAGRLTKIIYAAVVVAAILRIIAAILPTEIFSVLHAAGAAWIFAFFAFVIGYAPLLVRPRQEPQ